MKIHRSPHSHERGSLQYPSRRTKHCYPTTPPLLSLSGSQQKQLFHSLLTGSRWDSANTPVPSLAHAIAVIAHAPVLHHMVFQTPDNERWHTPQLSNVFVRAP